MQAAPRLSFSAPIQGGPDESVTQNVSLPQHFLLLTYLDLAESSPEKPGSGGNRLFACSIAFRARSASPKPE